MAFATAHSILQFTGKMVVKQYDKYQAEGRYKEEKDGQDILVFAILEPSSPQSPLSTEQVSDIRTQWLLYNNVPKTRI